MKRIILVFILLFSIACNNDKAKKQTVELSCGQCQFDLTTQKGCDLAVRIDGNAYFVDGAHIDDFGDAHDENTGFCVAIRKVEVEGEVINNRFKIVSVKLLDK